MRNARLNLPPAAVLFDLDGTLVDTAPDLVNATNQLRVENGLSPLPVACVRQEVSMGGRALTQLALGERADDKALARLLALYAGCLGDASRVFAGLAPVLASFDDNGTPWGIVTNKERRFAEPLLERMALTPGVLVCGDDIRQPKPAPDALLLAASQLSCRPGNAVYIVDHARDIEAAQRAGMAAIAVGYGYLKPTECIHDWGAEICADTPTELAAALMALFKT